MGDKLDLFIEMTNARLGTIEEKLDLLIQFKAAMIAEAKMKAFFVSAVVSIVGVAINLALHFLKA